MSNAFAIAGVTAVLEFMLNGIYSGSGLGPVTVSAKAPDLVQASLVGGTETALQVNLFLHQVTYNSAWRNVGQPAVAADGRTRLSNPPLALDLHYLLTAYASEDCAAEVLLGWAIQMMHETPVLSRSQIPAGLTSLPANNSVSLLLGSSGLAQQIEMIKITPATLGREELAWLWTALKADYRPTFPFQASVVLIEPQFSTAAGQPVLSRNVTVQAGPPAQLLAVEPPVGQTASGVGDIVTVTGVQLAGATLVALTNQRLGIQHPPFAPATMKDDAVSFAIPNVPAGVYSLSLLIGTGQSTNQIPIAIAPAILLAPAPVVVHNPGGVLVTLSSTPPVMLSSTLPPLPVQSVSLALDSTMAPLQSFSPPAALNFQFPPLAARTYLARLRVDGVDSPLTVNWAVNPPVFTAPKIVIV